jgi:hypothetical protein
VIRASIRAGNTVGTDTGAAIGTAPRCTGLLAIRILMPFSVEISIESTVDSSIMSMSFFT